MMGVCLYSIELYSQLSQELEHIESVTRVVHTVS